MDIEQIIAEEGDFEQWTDKETGFLCCVIRGQLMLAWRGYTQVPDGYVANGMNCAQLGHIAVHGKVSYSGDKFKDGNYWAGFHCAHGGDFLPWMSSELAQFWEYRTKEYAMHQVARLAWQIHLMGRSQLTGPRSA